MASDSENTKQQHANTDDTGASAMAAEGTNAPGVGETGDKALPGAGATVSEQPPDSTPPPTPSDAAAAHPGRGMAIVAVVALLVSVAAAAAFGFLWFRLDMGARLRSVSLQGDISVLQQRLEDLRGHSEQLSGQLERQVDQLGSQLQGQIDQLSGQVQGQLEQFRAEQASRAGAIDVLRGEVTELGATVGKLYEELDRSLDTWAVEEVEQLLLLANHRLQLSADVALATAALKIADSRLEEIADPAFVDVRRQLAEEMAALAAVPTVDVAGLALRLAALNGRVTGLPLKARPGFREGSDEAVPEGDGGDVGSQVVEAGREMWDDFRALLRIQHSGETRQPLLPPEQRYFLVQNLRLKLDSAQLGLLRGDAGVYHEALTAALDWLKEYFDTADESVVAMARELESLAGEQIRPTLPDISGSLSALRKSVEAKTRSAS